MHRRLRGSHLVDPWADLLVSRHLEDVRALVLHCHGVVENLSGLSIHANVDLIRQLGLVNVFQTSLTGFIGSCSSFLSFCLTFDILRKGVLITQIHLLLLVLVDFFLRGLSLVAHRVWRLQDDISDSTFIVVNLALSVINLLL